MLTFTALLESHGQRVSVGLGKVKAALLAVRKRVSSYSIAARRLVGFLALIGAIYLAVRAEEFSGLKFLGRWHLSHRPEWVTVQAVARANGYAAPLSVEIEAKIRRALPSGWDQSDWIWIEASGISVAAGEGILVSDRIYDSKQLGGRSQTWVRYERTWPGLESTLREIIRIKKESMSGLVAGAAVKVQRRAQNQGRDFRELTF
ncbi:MAG: hypothetical protein AAB425_15220 [Bdellovibrionota bacterium]